MLASVFWALLHGQLSDAARFQHLPADFIDGGGDFLARSCSRLDALGNVLRCACCRVGELPGQVGRACQCARGGFHFGRSRRQRRDHFSDHGLELARRVVHGFRPAHFGAGFLRCGLVGCRLRDHGVLEDLHGIGDLADFSGFALVRNVHAEIAG